MGQKKFVRTFRLADILKSEPNPIDLDQDIIKVLGILEGEFVSRKISYYYKRSVKENQKVLSVCFTEESIMHLIGISYYSLHERKDITAFNKPSYAKEFYKDFKRGQLSFEKCWVENIEKVIEKIKALDSILELKSNSVRIGECGQLRTMSLTNTLSTSKTCLGIGLHHDNPEFSIPKTCLNLSKDYQAKKNLSFSQTVRCLKIWEYVRLPDGNWKLINKQDFTKDIQIQRSAKKKKKNKKK